MSNHTCNRCVHLGGYYFYRRYAPTDLLEGKHSSKVWIAGLNSATKVCENLGKTRENLEHCFVLGERVLPLLKISDVSVNRSMTASTEKTALHTQILLNAVVSNSWAVNIAKNSFTTAQIIGSYRSPNLSKG